MRLLLLAFIYNKRKLVSLFFQTPSFSHSTPCLAPGLIIMHSAAAGIDEVFVFFMFSMYFRYIRSCIEFVSNSHRVFMVRKWISVIACGFLTVLSYFCVALSVSLLWQFYDRNILPQKVWLTVQSSIYTLLVYEYIIYPGFSIVCLCVYSVTGLLA